MVARSMTNCVNSTRFILGYFFFGGGDIFFIFHIYVMGGVFIKNMNDNIFPCLLSLLRELDCSCHIRLYLNKIFGLKKKKE